MARSPDISRTPSPIRSSRSVECPSTALVIFITTHATGSHVNAQSEKEGTVMSDATRRGFLVFAGAGTAAAVGAVAAPKLLGEQSADAAAQFDAADLKNAESFVVHVKDVKQGQLAIMVGEREVLITDRELAARLAGLKTT
jgi:hypothetical protein